MDKQEGLLAILIPPTPPEKETDFDKEICLFFIDINLCGDFRYVINDSICADALDMLLTQRDLYHIEFEQSEKHIDFVITKISSNRRLHIDKNYKYPYGSAFP